MIFSSNFVSLFRLTRLSLRLRCLVGLTFLPMTGLMVSFPRCGDEPWGQRRWLTDIFWNRVLKKISTLLEQIACLIPANNFFSVPTLSQSINTQKINLANILTSPLVNNPYILLSPTLCRYHSFNSFLFSLISTGNIITGENLWLFQSPDSYSSSSFLCITLM